MRRGCVWLGGLWQSLLCGLAALLGDAALELLSWALEWAGRGSLGLCRWRLLGKPGQDTQGHLLGTGVETRPRMSVPRKAGELGSEGGYWGRKPVLWHSSCVQNGRPAVTAQRLDAGGTRWAGGLPAPSRVPSSGDIPQTSPLVGAFQTNIPQHP